MRVLPIVRFLGLLLLVSQFSACEIINPEEDTPSYIQINKIVLDPRKSATETYGTASNNIVDAWVYANGKLIGVFQLPATIPILEKDSVKLEIKAGVYADGQKGLRFPYSFYTQYNKTAFLQPGKVTEIAPVVKFDPATVTPFDVYEEFTNFSGIAAIQVAPGSPYKLESNQDSLTNFPYANGWVGVVYANGSTDPIVLQSLFNNKLPQNGRPVFLEFDYRSTMKFKAGVNYTLNGVPNPVTDLTLNPTRTWTKMYLNLTDEVNNAAWKGASFQMLWIVQPNGNANDYFAIDNIRLIHY